MVRTRDISTEDVLTLHRAGRTVRQIARVMSCSDPAILKILNAHGLRSHGRSVVAERQQMLELWATPKTLVEIGAELGCSSTTVLRLQKAHDLPRRECVRPDPDEEVTPEEDAASADSLALSPWVQARIKELRLGLPQEVTA